MSYTGGIAGWADGSVTGCTNKQPLSIAANRLGDACRYAYAGGVAGKSTGAISGSKNRGNLTATAVCKFVIMGGIVGSADGAVSDVVNAASVSVPGNPEGANGPLKEAFFGPRYAYIGGVAGQVMGKGSVTGNGDTTNSGAVSIEQMEYATTDIIAAGGIVGMHLGKVSAAVNSGAVTVSATPASGTPAWEARCLGGIAGLVGEIGKDHSGASVSDSKNLAAVKHDRLVRANAMPVYEGGVAGYVLASDCTISGCANSGEVNSDFYNNNIEYDDNVKGKRANCTGGIVGAVVSTAEPNVVSTCSNSGAMVVYRGMAGGVVGYAQNTRVAECTNTGGFNASNRNGRSGGIAGQAMNSQITGCVNRAMVVADGTGDANPANLGGLVGVLSKGSSMSDCRHY